MLCAAIIIIAKNSDINIERVKAVPVQVHGRYWRITGHGPTVTIHIYGCYTVAVVHDTVTEM